MKFLPTGKAREALLLLNGAFLMATQQWPFMLLGVVLIYLCAYLQGRRHEEESILNRMTTHYVNSGGATGRELKSDER